MRNKTEKFQKYLDLFLSSPWNRVTNREGLASELPEPLGVFLARGVVRGCEQPSGVKNKTVNQQRVRV